MVMRCRWSGGHGSVLGAQAGQARDPVFDCYSISSAGLPHILQCVLNCSSALSICPHVRKRVQPSPVHQDYSLIPSPVVENWEEHGHTCESSHEVLT